MNRTHRLISLVLLISLALLLSGCGSISIGGSSGGLFGQGGISRTIIGSTSEIITGSSFHASAGKTIAVTYRATVKEGFLSIWVRQAGLLGLSADRLGTARVDRTGSGSLIVIAPKSANYEVVVSPWGFGGDFEVGWKVR